MAPLTTTKRIFDERILATARFALLDQYGARLARVAASITCLYFLADITATAATERGSNDDGESSALEVVVVTAQKRSERLQDVPISISVLSGADLDRSSIQGVS